MITPIYLLNKTNTVKKVCECCQETELPLWGQCLIWAAVVFFSVSFIPLVYFTVSSLLEMYSEIISDIKDFFNKRRGE